jgi:hypothetical protein
MLQVGSISEVMEGRALEANENLCGRTLARAHARTGDPPILAGYMRKSEVLDEALASFAGPCRANKARPCPIEGRIRHKDKRCDRVIS